MENSQPNLSSIRHWSVDDRPREKLVKHGPDFLSNAELLAIILNNGTRNKSALELAREILLLGDNNLHELGKLSLSALQKLDGIGASKAVSVLAALELGRRREGAGILQRPALITAREAATFLQALLKDKTTELFVVIYLNRAGKVKNYRIVSRGGITGTVADTRVIMKQAIDEQATSIILSHNHPSGSLHPSNADLELTQKIKEAGKLLDIRVMDHIIVSDEGYYSFADQGLI